MFFLACCLGKRRFLYYNSIKITQPPALRWRLLPCLVKGRTGSSPFFPILMEEPILHDIRMGNDNFDVFQLFLGEKTQFP